MRYKKLIGRMTLEEKASLLSGENFWKTKRIDRLGIPSITLADGPHGIRKQEGDADHLGLHKGVPATCFPPGSTVANSWDPSLSQRIGNALGEEARYHGVDVVLGPGMNIKRDPLCGRSFEYLSEDPYLSGKMAAGYVVGIQERGVVSCPKHFVANNQEHLRMTSNSVIDSRTLHEIYLKGFEIVVKEAHPKAMMSAYNQVNGTYANEHSELLQDILVKQWGFSGFVVTDWGGSNDHISGVLAGSHLEMPATGGDSDRELVKAVELGLLSESVLDQRVDELLHVIFTIKKLQEESSYTYDVDGNHHLAQKVAEESTVLLKNDDDILPLPDYTRVAIIGDFAKTPRYQGAGSSLVNPTKLDNFVDAVSDSSLDVIGYAQGFLRSGKSKPSLIKEACSLASEADVVLYFMGLEEVRETEGMDRTHAALSENQVSLLKTLYGFNKHIVVVLSCGSYVEMDWLDRCKGLLHGYLGGQAGAKGVVRILTGEVNPSGKLSETYPFLYKDTPTYQYYPGKGRTAEYREGLYVGYRYYSSIGKSVQFPFGYGLSYTQFDYSDLKVTQSEVSCNLTNTGSVAGSEIVQLYLGFRGTSYVAPVFRPVKELKGFSKIYLQPGETQRVSISFNQDAFGFYSIQSHQFEVISGEYTIMLGASVEDIRLEELIFVNGSLDTCDTYDSRALEHYFSGDITEVPDEEFELLLGRPLPPSERDRSKPLTLNDPVKELRYAKSFLARRVGGMLRYLKNRSIEKGKPDLNILFMYNIPFRGIAKMMNGMVSMEMTHTLLYMANGHPFRGLCRLFGGWCRLRKAKKETTKALRQAGESSPTFTHNQSGGFDD